MTLLLTSFFSKEPEVKKIEIDSQIDLFNSIRMYRSIDSKHFRVKVFLLDNKPGSAGIVGTGEISSRLFFGISEFDEYPKQSLFEINNLVNPKIKGKKINDENIELTIEHYNSGKTKLNTIRITSHKVEWF